MSTTACRECSKEVAHMANVCPHCGAKDPALSHNAQLAIYIWTGVFALWFWFFGWDMMIK